MGVFWAFNGILHNMVDEIKCSCLKYCCVTLENCIQTLYKDSIHSTLARLQLICKEYRKEGGNILFLKVNIVGAFLRELWRKIKLR